MFLENVVCDMYIYIEIRYRLISRVHKLRLRVGNNCPIVNLRKFNKDYAYTLYTNV